MENINTYTYEVHKNIMNIPLHIVQVKSELLAAFAVFNNSKDAQKYIVNTKKSLEEYGIHLKYNQNLPLLENLLNMYISSQNGLCTNLKDKSMYIC